MKSVGCRARRSRPPGVARFRGRSRTTVRRGRPASVCGVERPSQFEHHRWVGDKRIRVVYDVDALDDTDLMNELLESKQFLCFGPDTLAEARNRGYRPYRGTGA